MAGISVGAGTVVGVASERLDRRRMRKARELSGPGVEQSPGGFGQPGFRRQHESIADDVKCRDDRRTLRRHPDAGVRRESFGSAHVAVCPHVDDWFFVCVDAHPCEQQGVAGEMLHAMGF